MFQNRVVEGYQNFEDPYHITGYTSAEAWVERDYYYDIEFDTPYTVKEELPLRDAKEKAHRYVLSFNLENGKPLTVKMSFSKTSIENAKNNIKTELPNWDLNQVKNDAKTS